MKRGTAKNPVGKKMSSAKSNRTTKIKDIESGVRTRSAIKSQRGQDIGRNNTGEQGLRRLTTSQNKRSGK